MNKINSIHIQGYKSIRDQEIELGPVNVLIGANGSGKSNFASLFGLLEAIGNGSFQRYVALHGGANSLLHYGAKSTPSLSINGKIEVDGVVISFGTSALYSEPDTLFEDDLVGGGIGAAWAGNHFGLAKLLQVMGSWRVYQFWDTTERAAIRQHGYINDGNYLRADAGNLAAVLYGLSKSKPDYYGRILSTIRLALPFFDDFILVPTAADPNSILLDWKERGSDYRFGPHQIADGALRFITLTTLLLQPTEMMPSVIIIDEPELGLHPYAISLLGSMIKGVSTERQVIVATQSTELLDQFEADDVIVVDREERETIFRRQNSDQLKEWLEEYTVSELWKKNVLGGRPHR